MGRGNYLEHRRNSMSHELYRSVILVGGGNSLENMNS